MSIPKVYVIRERGPKRPDETLAEYARRIVDGAPPLNPDDLPRLVALLRSGRIACGEDGV